MPNKKEIDYKVEIKKTSLINEREFHIRTRLNDYPEDYSCLADSKDINNKEYVNRLLAEALFKIGGMQEIFISGYVINITISAAFSWEELEVRILECVKLYLRTKILEGGMGE